MVTSKVVPIAHVGNTVLSLVTNTGKMRPACNGQVKISWQVLHNFVVWWRRRRTRDHHQIDSTVAAAPFFGGGFCYGVILSVPRYRDVLGLEAAFLHHHQ